MRSGAYSGLIYDAADIVHEVLAIIQREPDGEYARRNDETDHESYFRRCIKIFLKAERRRICAKKQTFNSRYYEPLHDINITSAYAPLIDTDTPEKLLIDRDNLRAAHNEVLDVTAPFDRNGTLRRYAENIIYCHEDTETIADKLGTTQENVRQARSRLGRLLKKKILTVLLLSPFACSGLSAVAWKTFEVTTYVTF